MNVKILPVDKDYIPVFKHDDDACCDCRAYGTYVINPKTRMKVNLGFKMQLLAGYEAVIRPRSSLSDKGIDIAIGTIDGGYTGTVMAEVINNSNEQFSIADKDRICQMAIRETPKVTFTIVDKLDETKRGENGFGSTGRN